MDKLLVASEYTDPSIYDREIADMLHETSGGVGLLLITKYLGGCWRTLVKANSKGIPTIIHATHTGLGGSVLEPGITEKVYTELIYSIDTWKNIYPEAKFVLRIDPVIPNHSSEAVIYTMMKVASERGVQNVRFSIMDCYPFVKKRFHENHLSISHTFQYSNIEINSWAAKLANFANCLNMKLNVCAERIQKEIIAQGCGTEGCASVKEWAELGLDIQPLSYKQRELCTCTAEKHDLLKGQPCNNGCLYCYYSKNREKV